MAIWGNKIIISVNGKVITGEFKSLTCQNMSVRITQPKYHSVKHSHATLCGYTHLDKKSGEQKINGNGRRIAELLLESLYKPR